MDILIQADGVTLTDSLKATVDEKIGRIEHYMPRALLARVHLRKVSAHPSARQFIVHVVCDVPHATLSAEESGPNVISALDSVAEKLEARARKLKTTRLASREKENLHSRLKKDR
jgi:putative sigma-54 modulation protein